MAGSADDRGPPAELAGPRITGREGPGPQKAKLAFK